MARSNPELWQRLTEFEVSPQGAVFSFTRRLARENRWSLEFTRRAFDEYRRFLYLCVVVGQPLTPSEAVGQTWQLHLAYPGSYGQALCRDVLGRPLRHQPPDGTGQPVGLEAGYRATLAAYEREFGCAPPTEIWPDPEPRPAAAAAPAGRRAEQPRRAKRKPRRTSAAPLMPAAGRA